MTEDHARLRALLEEIQHAAKHWQHDSLVADEQWAAAKSWADELEALLGRPVVPAAHFVSVPVDPKVVSGNLVTGRCTDDLPDVVPAETAPSPLLIGEWSARIEQAIYGKSGNTMTVRQLAALRAVIAAMLQAPAVVPAASQPQETKEDNTLTRSRTGE